MTAFSPIVAQTISYTGTSPGEYSKAGLAFGSPRDIFRVRPGSARKDGMLTAAVTRIKEKDVTVNGDTVRVTNICTTNWLSSPGGHFTAAESVSLLTDIAAFSTATNLNDLFLGKR
jgi:hypothetical protein